MSRDDSNVTPLPRRDAIGGVVSDVELTRVVNLLLESNRMTTQRIEAYERASAQLRDSDRAHYEAMRVGAAEDRRTMLSAMKDQGVRIEMLVREMSRLREMVAAYTGQAPDSQGTVKKYAPAVLGGAGGGFALLELAKYVAQALDKLQG